ncbi:MAG: hypothetical protein ACKO0V_19495 [bacterium]
MPTPSRKFRSFRLNPSFRANRNRHRPLVDSLEDRTLLTCTLDSQGLLQVLGTASADTINISLNSATQNIEVFENSVKTGVIYAKTLTGFMTISKYTNMHSA